MDDFYDLTSEQIFKSTNAYWILATSYWLLFVGSEIGDVRIEQRGSIAHLTSHIYDAVQLRAIEPSQKGEMARSFSIIGGMTSRIKSISSSVL
jgi:hypothetical protein